MAVISTPRSGSGYFCEKLTHTGVFGNVDEWFHPDIFKIIAKQENSQPVRFTSFLKAASKTKFTTHMNTKNLLMTRVLFNPF